MHFNENEEEESDVMSLDEINIDDIQSTPSMCLIINQEYQNQLEEFISLIEDKLEENRDKQRYLKEKMNGIKKASTKENSYIHFITPYFRDHKGIHPPPNEDTKQKQLNGELNQNYAVTIKKWSLNDENNLLNTVKEFYIKDQLEALRKQKNKLAIDLKINENDKFRCERLNAELEECDRQIKRSIDSSLIYLNNDLEDKIDWLYVSKLMDDVYDNLNCRLYWVNYLHPQISKQDWTADELNKLSELTKDQDHFDWQRIAQQLNSSRKAWQVAKQYQITFNSNIKHNGAFTEEEINHLTTVIERCQIGDYIPWNQVYYFIDGRSTFQLKQFWEKHIRRDKPKEYWTLLEDTILHVGFIKFNANWKKIAFCLPDRTNRQCRERYVNRLSISNRRVGNWTVQEDKQLKSLIEQHLTDFKQIAKLMQGRSENQIKSRCKVLTKIKVAGEQVSHKKNRAFELETMRLSYLEEKIRRIKNFESFLSNARDQLINGLGKEKQKQKDTELLKLRLAKKNSTKSEEDRIDSEIIKMFEHYNLIPTKFQNKPNSTSSDNLCLNENVISYLDCLLNGLDSKDDYLLNNVIKYLFKNEITDFSTKEDDEVDKQHPAILPPNKTTMLAFFGVLMQKDNLQKLIEESQEEVMNFNLDEMRSDPNYKHLTYLFNSLFLLPAILTDTQLTSLSLVPFENDDEETENSNNSNDVNKKATTKKRKNSIITKQERQNKALVTTKIRQQQKELIDSYFKYFKHQNCDEN